MVCRSDGNGPVTVGYTPVQYDTVVVMSGDGKMKLTAVSPYETTFVVRSRTPKSNVGEGPVTKVEKGTGGTVVVNVAPKLLAVFVVNTELGEFDRDVAIGGIVENTVEMLRLAVAMLEETNAELGVLALAMLLDNDGLDAVEIASVDVELICGAEVEVETLGKVFTLVPCDADLDMLDGKIVGPLIGEVVLRLESDTEDLVAIVSVWMLMKPETDCDDCDEEVDMSGDDFPGPEFVATLADLDTDLNEDTDDVLLIIEMLDSVVTEVRAGLVVEFKLVLKLRELVEIVVVDVVFSRGGNVTPGGTSNMELELGLGTVSGKLDVRDAMSPESDDTDVGDSVREEEAEGLDVSSDGVGLEEA